MQTLFRRAGSIVYICIVYMRERFHCVCRHCPINLIFFLVNADRINCDENIQSARQLTWLAVFHWNRCTTGTDILKYSSRDIIDSTDIIPVIQSFYELNRASITRVQAMH